MPPHAPKNLLITAGPTHEPVDAVRYLANRSSGRLGVELADAAVRRDRRATLLLGPTHLEPSDTRVEVRRFRTASDLRALLTEHLPHCDALIMAAAVADYRPALKAGQTETKIRRTDAGLTLALEPLPDLLAMAAAERRPDQTIIGFALEPGDGILDAARAKLERKGVDAIVANPLKTMDSADIEATLVLRDGRAESTDGPMGKAAFAVWLLDHLDGIAAGAGRVNERA